MRCELFFLGIILIHSCLMFCSFADLQKPQVELDGKACAAVGQNSLMALYDTLFSEVVMHFLFHDCIRLPCFEVHYQSSFFLYTNIICTFISQMLRLIWNAFSFSFLQLDISSAQLLVTDSDFRDRDFRKQLNETVKSLLSLKVIPIFNENDAVSTRKAPYEVLCW